MFFFLIALSLSLSLFLSFSLSLSLLHFQDMSDDSVGVGWVILILGTRRASGAQGLLEGSWG